MIARSVMGLAKERGDSFTVLRSLPWAAFGLLAACGGPMLSEGERTRRELEGRDAEAAASLASLAGVPDAADTADEIIDQLDSAVQTAKFASPVSSTGSLAPGRKAAARAPEGAPKRTVTPALLQECSPPLPRPPTTAGTYTCKEPCFKTSRRAQAKCEKGTRRIETTPREKGGIRVRSEITVDSGWKEVDDYIAKGELTCSTSTLTIPKNQCPDIVNVLFSPSTGGYYSSYSTIGQITTILPLYVRGDTFAGVMLEFERLASTPWISGVRCYDPVARKTITCPSLALPTCSCSMPSAQTLNCSFCGPVMKVDVVAGSCNPQYQSCTTGQILCTDASDAQTPDRCRLIDSKGVVVINIPRCSSADSNHSQCSSPSYSTAISCTETTCSGTGWELTDPGGAALYAPDGRKLMEISSMAEVGEQGIERREFSREEILSRAKGNSPPLVANRNCEVTQIRKFETMDYIRGINPSADAQTLRVLQGLSGFNSLESTVYIEGCTSSGSYAVAFSEARSTGEDAAAVFIADDVLFLSYESNALCAGERMSSSDKVKASVLFPSGQSIQITDNSCVFYSRTTYRYGAYEDYQVDTEWPVRGATGPVYPKKQNVTGKSKTSSVEIRAPESMTCPTVESDETVTTYYSDGKVGEDKRSVRTNVLTCKPEVTVAGRLVPLDLTCPPAVPVEGESTTPKACTFSKAEKFQTELEAGGSRLPVAIDIKSGTYTTTVDLADTLNGQVEIGPPDADGFTSKATFTAKSPKDRIEYQLSIRSSPLAGVKAKGSIPLASGAKTEFDYSNADGKKSTTFRLLAADEAERASGVLEITADPDADLPGHMIGSGTLQLSTPKGEVKKLNARYTDEGCVVLETEKGEPVNRICR